MLSYQHAYHAGGPADLHKHIVLAELLARLTAKPRGIAYLETHAGRGRYDLAAPEDEEDVDRASLLKVFRDYLQANDMSADWDQVRAASTEALVNTLAVLAPYAPRDKQALLEAKDLKSRADVLIALTEMALARQGSGTSSGLQ